MSDLQANEIFTRIWTAFDNCELVSACAWCGRVRVNGTWIVPPPAALVAIDAPNTLSHSICDECVRAYDAAS